MLGLGVSDGPRSRKVEVIVRTWDKEEAWTVVRFVIVARRRARGCHRLALHAGAYGGSLIQESGSQELVALRFFVRLSV